MDWIDCNLPFSEPTVPREDRVYPPSPDLSVEEKAKFGITGDELEAEFESKWKDIRAEWGRMNSQAWEEQQAREAQAYQNKKKVRHVSSETIDRRVRKAFKAKGPQYVEFFERRALRTKMGQWTARHPATAAHQKACERITYEGTFKGLGMIQPGVQIELANGKRFLLGHVNCNRGVCDDCTAFDSHDIVVRYRVLVPAEIL